MTERYSTQTVQVEAVQHVYMPGTWCTVRSVRVFHVSDTHIRVFLRFPFDSCA